SRHRGIESRDRTRGVGVLTERGEAQPGRASEGLYVGNTNEYHFMSARFHPASERGHWVQVAGNRQTHEADLHSCSLFPFSRRVSARGARRCCGPNPAVRAPRACNHLACSKGSVWVSAITYDAMLIPRCT